MNKHVKPELGPMPDLETVKLEVGDLISITVTGRVPAQFRSDGTMSYLSLPLNGELGNDVWLEDCVFHAELLERKTYGSAAQDGA